jgi:hypothetical protein
MRSGDQARRPVDQGRLGVGGEMRVATAPASDSRAPRRTLEAPSGEAPRSTRRTTSGCKTSSRASKSPRREA